MSGDPETPRAGTARGAPVDARARVLVFALFLIWPMVLVDANGPSMTDSVLWAAMRLADHGTFTLSGTDDAATVSRTVAFDVSVHEGRVYSGIAPGATVVAAAVYATVWPALAAFDAGPLVGKRAVHYYARSARELGRVPDHRLRTRHLLHVALVWLVIAPLFASFGARWLAFLRRQGTEPAPALAICLATGFGTMALYYATMYTGQSLAYPCVWHAALTLARGRRLDAGALVGAGALCGLAIAVDYPSVLLVALLLVSLAPRLGWRERALVVAPVALALVALGAYHGACFGSPFSTPYEHRHWNPLVDGQVGGLDPSAFEKGHYVGMNLPSVGVMLQLLVGLHKGLFVYSPILLVALIGHVRGLRAGAGRGTHVICVAACLVVLVFNSTMGTHLPPRHARYVWGGLSILWGPRHLFALLPFAAYGLSRLDWRRPSERAALLLALGASCAISVAGALSKHVLMTMPALSPKLEVPIAQAFRVLLAQGPRVSLLEAHGVSGAAQAGVFVWLLVATCVLLWGVLRAGVGAATSVAHTR